MDAYIEDKLFERVDFTKVPLEMGAYEHCRFVDCDFSGADLSNPRSAVDYSIDPESNRIKKAKFALLGLGGLLEKYDIVID